MDGCKNNIISILQEPPSSRPLVDTHSIMFTPIVPPVVSELRTINNPDPSLASASVNISSVSARSIGPKNHSRDSCVRSILDARCAVAIPEAAGVPPLPDPRGRKTVP